MFRSCAAGMALAIAATAVPATANDEAAPGDKKQKVICKSDAVTGSRLKKKRICMTAEEWDKVRARTQKDIGDLQRSSGRAPEGTSPLG